MGGSLERSADGFAPVWVVTGAVLWQPVAGEEFEGRLRHGDSWYRMRWHGWSKVNPSQAIIEALEPGPRPYDVLTGMRPLPIVWRDEPLRGLDRSLDAFLEDPFDDA